MSLSSLISGNLTFAINQIAVTLTAVTPTNSEVYIASKQDVEEGFEIFEEGREESIDTKFYINRGSYASLPTKGMVLTDGTTNFKVMNIHDDSISITRRLDCASQYQR